MWFWCSTPGNCAGSRSFRTMLAIASTALQFTYNASLRALHLAQIIFSQGSCVQIPAAHVDFGFE